MALCNRLGEMNQQKSMYVMTNIFEYVYEFSPKTLPYEP